MAISKIILFYVFTPLADPEAVRLWQTALASKHHLTGRVIISTHGINATLGGRIEDLKQYAKVTRSYAPFRSADIKWSEGGASDFPRLSVKVRPELVTFTVPEEVHVDEAGVQGGGVHLKPEQVHELVDQRGKDVVFFDGRNAMEAQIGRFKDAIIPPTDTTRDFINALDKGTYDHLKDQPIITYCTGGIRCEVLTVLMKNRGFSEVYQLDGGIVRYGEKYGNDGLWDGSLYVFDKRMHVEFGDGATSLGHCGNCGQATAEFVNCEHAWCREQYLRCDVCSAAGLAPLCPTCAE
ncbi:MAG: rhodanese-related sulfurtransferase [Dermabacter sp.]|nr:rhodanese-related sulfurtransferase [Dermabacter sp.]